MVIAAACVAGWCELRASRRYDPTSRVSWRTMIGSTVEEPKTRPTQASARVCVEGVCEGRSLPCAWNRPRHRSTCASSTATSRSKIARRAGSRSELASMRYSHAASISSR